MDFLQKQSFNIDIKTELEDARRADFLPYICLTNEKVGDAPWKIYHSERGVLDGDKEALVTHLTSRVTIRRLMGQHYTNRAYLPLNESHQGLTRAIFEKNFEKAKEREEKWELGYTHLIVLLEEGESPSICTYESFSRGDTELNGVPINLFLSTPILLAPYPQKKIAKFTPNFEKMVKLSANGFNYLAYWLFKEGEGFTIEDISEDLFSSTQEQIESQKEQIQGFLDK